MHSNAQQSWKTYCQNELALLEPVITMLGFTLEEHQPHLGGERHLMQAITTTSGRKLILLGKEVVSGKRVVVKATRNVDGMREISHERTCRTALKNIAFAYQVFFSPDELFFGKHGGFLISIQTFIEHDQPFLERPVSEAFALALRAFKAQESAHATTYAHERMVQKTFGSIDAEGYLASYRSFMENIRSRIPERSDIHTLLIQGESALMKDRAIIEQYCGFLTHTDFVPHNIRIAGDTIYLLDHASIRFGNKYEGWARFLNFMTLYWRELEDALLFYVRNNRTPEEYRSLELMRIFRLGEIIWYYTKLLEQTSGNLRELTETRITFWGQVLEATLAGTLIPESIVHEYQKKRNRLRSPEEQERQKGLH